jgi:SAM-dependent methyltransferase
MNIYTDYAPIYDIIGQTAFGEHLAAHVIEWRNEREPQKQSPLWVLDLACGTGAAALAFAAAGCCVVGVDRAPAMLDIARSKARDRGLEAAFIQKDIRHLPNHDLQQAAPLIQQAPFDLVTCFFDSLNYLIEDDDLVWVCQGVSRLLRPDGHFIFDLNTEAEFITWDELDEVVYDNGDYLVYNRLNYEPDHRLATGRVVWFTRENDRWWRGEETHIERAWRDEEVLSALRANGLTLLERRTPEGEPADERAPRIVYFAERSAS